MKKLLLLLIIFSPFIMNAQLTSDDFESYTAGSFDTQWDPNNWVGWFGAGSGVDIVDTIANSGSNSMVLELNDDVVALLGTLNSGTYEISFMQYVPAGNGAYFNLQHNYTNTAGDWAAEFYFSDDNTGTVRVITDGVPTDTPGLGVHDAWVEHRVIANFNTMVGQYYYNGVILHAWMLNTNASGGAGLNQLNGINFFGACLDEGPGCTSLAYYDDVNITFIPPPDYDLLLAEFATPSEYTIVPTGLEAPFNLEATVTNIGAADASDVSVTFTVSDGGGVVYTETSAALGALAPGASNTFIPMNAFTPTAGTYTVDYQVNLTETDTNPANNSAATSSFTYTLDPSIYARDDGNYTDGLGVNGGTGTLGHNFDFSLPVGVSSIQTSSIGGGVGESIIGHIYSTNADGSPNMLIASTDTTIISTPGALGSPVDYTLSFPAIVNLPVGDYVFAVEQAGNTSFSLSTTPNIYTSESSWATTDMGATWTTLEGIGFQLALHIRPELSGVDVVDVQETENYVNTLEINPNPSTGLFNLQIELSETKSLQIDIFDALGKLIDTNNIGQTQGGQYNIDLSGMSSGVYFVRCQIADQILTRRVLVNK